MSDALIVFLRAPRPGQVKTRLAKGLGATAACHAYRQMVETLLGRLTSLKEVELCFSPSDAAAEIEPWLRPGWQARPQSDGDLGRRLQEAFARAFDAGAKHVAIIGSDCPEVTADDVRNAWSQLRSTDLVLGPAHDGGYWLIGIRQPQPELFQEISWGSRDVLRQTLARAAKRALQVRLLRELKDIDTEMDWREFLAKAG